MIELGVPDRYKRRCGDSQILKMRKLMTEKPNVWTDDRLEGLKKLWSEGLSISQIREALESHVIPLPEKRIGWACRNVHHQSVAQRLKNQKLWRLRCPELPLRLELRQLEWSRNAVGQLATPRKTAFCSAVGRLFRKPYCLKHCYEAYTTSRDPTDWYVEAPRKLCAARIFGGVG